MYQQLTQVICKKGILSPNDMTVITRWYDGNIYNTDDARITTILDMLHWIYERNEYSDKFHFDPSAAAALIDDFSKRFGVCIPRSRELLERYIAQDNVKRPVFIAVEGLDGSGKTVQCKKLVDYLTDSGKRVFYIDFPQYNSFIGKEIGFFLSGKDNNTNADSIDPKSMCLWYATDRLNALKDVDFSRYDFVIFNRYTLSSAVYQTARFFNTVNSNFINWVFELEHVILGLPAPDIYLFLDTPISGCSENLTHKGERSYVEGLDIYECSKSLLACCREIYHYCVKAYSSVRVISCSGPNGLFPVEDIHHCILRELSELGLKI